MKHNFAGITIILNGSCNLNCDYCFINKKHSSVFKSITEELLDAIDSDYYINKLLEIIPNEDDRKRIDRLDFWGGEPTLHLDYAYKIVEKLLQVAPNIRNLMFSSNFALPDADMRVERFLLDLKRLHKEKYNETNPFVVSIQMSVDGPPQFTDRNRGDNVADFIFENFKKLMPKLRYLCDRDHLIYHTHVHGVCDTETLEMFEDIDNVEAFFDYFHKYRQFLADNAIAPNDPDHKIICEPADVLMFPTPETSLTGDIAAKAMKTLLSFWERGNQGRYMTDFWHNCVGWFPGDASVNYHLRQRQIPRNLDKDGRIAFLRNIIKEIETHDIISEAETKTYCGAGISTLLMSPNNKYAVCQNIYFDLYPEYVNQFVDDNVPNTRYIKNKNMSYRDETYRWTFDTYEKYDRFIQNVEEAYRNIRDNSYYGNELVARTFIKTSAKAGIIDKKYLIDKECNYAAKYIDININCMSLLLQQTGSLYVPILYYVPLYLNGAIDFIEKMIIMQIERAIENEQR